MYTPIATSKQIAYLQHLTDRAEYYKMRHPSVIPDGLYYRKWELGITSEKIGLYIQMYRSILDKANAILYPRKKVAENEDLPA